MSKYTSEITEIGRDEEYAYGVRFIVCGNAETISDGHTAEAEDGGNGWREEAGEAHGAAAGVVLDGGFDYDTEASFQAYHGGPRDNLVDAIYFEAEIDEGGDLGGWAPAHWHFDRASMKSKQRPPAEFAAEAERVRDAASTAMTTEMERLASES